MTQPLIKSSLSDFEKEKKRGCAKKKVNSYSSILES